MVKPWRSCVGAIAVLAVLPLLVSGCGSGAPTPQQPTVSKGTAPPPPPPLSPTSPPTPVAAPVTAWEPSALVLEQLEPYKDVAGYQIRVPKGWIASAAQASPGAKMFVWYGVRPNDNKGAVLRICVLEPPEPASPDYQEFKKATLDSAFDDGLKTVTRDGGVTADKQTGEVNGIPFARTNAAFRKEADGGYVVQSVLYVGKDGLSIVILTFSDVESRYAESAKLGISAILTFRKKP
jgi:hypothetical protein